MNWFTEMTPYAVVTLGAIRNEGSQDANHEIQRLRVVATGSIPPAHGKNPLWDLKLTFDVEQLDFPVSKMTLLVTVYSGNGNINGTNSDTVIGRVNPIDIENIIPRNGERAIYRIDTGGTISMTIKYIDKCLLSSNSDSSFDGQNNSTASLTQQNFSSLSGSSKESMQQNHRSSVSSKNGNNIFSTSLSSYQSMNDEQLPVATLVDIKKADL